MKKAYPYTADDLYNSIYADSTSFVLLDVRNQEAFDQFKVEGPYLNTVLNIPYFDFIEFQEESLKKVPQGHKIKIVCAKEGSAKFVADILIDSGWNDVGYLAGGIGTWADLLEPVLIDINDRYDLYQFIRPGKASLSYGLVCDKALFVFDPARTCEFYLDFAKKHHLKLTRVFETHLQADYISGSRAIADVTGAEIFAHPGDFSIATFDYSSIKDNDVFLSPDGRVSVKAVHTPGHTPGSTSYLIDDRFLISGDAVFIRSIGRPDLGGRVDEWSKLLFQTIRNVLKKMDSSIQVLPGHYMDWAEMTADGKFIESLGMIFKHNRAIYDIENEVEFTEFIKANMRKQPDVYAEIRRINAGLLEPTEEEQKIMDVGKNECAATTS